MDELDKKLNETFDGKVLRKDLLHRIKKGTNVPTFVLEFLLAKYCASNDQAELDAGMEAVLSSLQENYVRPDEANAAQSKVATKGKHRFIDKVHVRYVEKEKRHWASLENFNSQRIAIGEKFYRDNDRLLEGGIWAEVTLVHNDIDEDDYAFSIEDLRPIQLTRFDFSRYTEGRAAFTRDEWLAAVLRSVGLEPMKLSHRVKMHFIARLAALVVRPRVHVVHFHGVLAPNAAWRPEVVPDPTEVERRRLAEEAKRAESTLTKRTRRRRLRARRAWCPWSQLLEQEFGVGGLTCPHCGGPMRVRAVVTREAEATRILATLRRSARGPPIGVGAP